MGTKAKSDKDGRIVRGKKRRAAKSKVWRGTARWLKQAVSSNDPYAAAEASRLAKELTARAKALG